MSEIIGEGDKVLVYIDEKRKFIVKVQRGKILGTDRGYILHDDLVGRRIGDIVETSMKSKAILLRPLTHDYVEKTKRATQIIYPKDAGFMIYLSGIGPGGVVGEAGVGTGALTIALASIVGDTGKVYGFDVNDKALEQARENLELAGLQHRVVLTRRDIREKIEVQGLDAFFLDIPDPWSALANIHVALKPSKPVLIFLPTVNQVVKTLDALINLPYADIHVYETMLREYTLRPDALRPHTRMIGHTGYVIYARKTLVKYDSQ